MCTYIFCLKFFLTYPFSDLRFLKSFLKPNAPCHKSWNVKKYMAQVQLWTTGKITHYIILLESDLKRKDTKFQYLDRPNKILFISNILFFVQDLIDFFRSKTIGSDLSQWWVIFFFKSDFNYLDLTL